MTSPEIRETRRLRAKARRLKFGVATVDGLIISCRNCKKLFAPRNIRALSCSITCAKEWLRHNRIRPGPIARFASKLQWNHGLSVAQYEATIDGQGQVCKLCKEPFVVGVRALEPCIDHNHECCRIGASCDRCRRGVIHQRCNLVLGHAKDNIGLLRMAVTYLENDALLL